MRRSMGRVAGIFLPILLLCLSGSPLWAQEHVHSEEAMHANQPQATVSPTWNEKLPADEDHAKMALDKSPRHGEYVDIALPGSTTKIRTWIVYPERKQKAPAIIVIHEIFGLSDWIRAVADQLAKDGYIAVAPDLLSGKGPGGGGTDSVPTRDDVVKLIRTLTPDEALARLDAVRTYAIHLPAANGKSASVGFCWGGSTSFAFATTEPDLNAAVVYYGTAPVEDKLAKIKAPVLGFYGEDDARVTATVDPTSATMKKLGKAYTPHIYKGAGHGFARAQTGRDGANMKAIEQAWPTMLAFLKINLA